MLIVAILGRRPAGDQETGAHNWTYYPGGSGGYYMDYASAAAFVAPRARAGDGIVYQAREHQDSWLMVGYGLQYYLARDMPNGVPVPHKLFIARTAAQAGTLYPEPCQRPAACLGAEPRIWVIGVGRQESPYQAVTLAQAAAGTHRPSLVKHQRSLTVLLTRTPGPFGPVSSLVRPKAGNPDSVPSHRRSAMVRQGLHRSQNLTPSPASPVFRADSCVPCSAVIPDLKIFDTDRMKRRAMSVLASFGPVKLLICAGNCVSQPASCPQVNARYEACSHRTAHTRWLAGIDLTSCCNQEEANCAGSHREPGPVRSVTPPLPRRTPARRRPRATARTRRAPSRPPAVRPRRTRRAPGPWRTSCAA